MNEMVYIRRNKMERKNNEKKNTSSFYIYQTFKHTFNYIVQMGLKIVQVVHKKAVITGSSKFKF